MDPSVQKPHSESKRRFFKQVLLVLGGAVTLAASWGMGRFALFSRDKKKVREVPREVLGKLEPDVPFHVADAEVWVLKRKSDEGIVALDDRCTHLGCRPNWNPQRKLFECPCHGSEFDADGSVTRGPAKLPMARLGISMRDGEKVRLLEKSPSS